MAAFEVIALDTAAPQLRAPGSADQYTFPRAITGTSNTIQQYSGTSAQRYELFNTRTDASNYELLFLDFSSNVARLGTLAAGTGTQRNLALFGAQVDVSTRAGADTVYGALNVFTPNGSTRGIKITIGATSVSTYPFSIFDSNGAARAYVDTSWRWYSTEGFVAPQFYTDRWNPFAGNVDLVAAPPVGRAFSVVGASATTADIFTVKNSGGTLLLSVTKDGDLRYGTHSAIGAETVTGYITIKDAGGTTRKLAVVS